MLSSLQHVIACCRPSWQPSPSSASSHASWPHVPPVPTAIPCPSEWCFSTTTSMMLPATSWPQGQPTRLQPRLSVCSCASLSVSLCVSSYVCSSVCALSANPFVCPFVCVPVCQSIHVFICLFVSAYSKLILCACSTWAGQCTVEGSDVCTPVSICVSSND